MQQHPVRALGRLLMGYPALRYRPAAAYAAAVAITAAALAVPIAVDVPFLGDPFLTLFPATILCAYLGGFGPGLLSALGGAVAAWLFAVPHPAFDPDYHALAIVLYTVVAALTALIVDGLRLAYESIAALAGQRAILLLEQQHRVKNHVQLISAILGVHARLSGSEAARQGLLEARARLNVVAGAYANLYTPGTTIAFHDHLRGLAETLRTGVAGRGVTIAVEADDALWGPDLVVPVSLIANELITNALEHGAPGQPVRVSLRRAGGQMLLAVSSGSALPAEFSAKDSAGLGLRIVQMLVRQIKGELKVEHATGTFAVAFPEPTKAAAARLDPALG